MSLFPRPQMQDMGALPLPVPPMPSPTMPTPGVNPMASAPPPPQGGGGGGLDRILQLIAPMMTVGLALSGNRAAATGAAQGLTQSRVQEQEMQMAQQAMRMREQDMAERAAARAQNEAIRLENQERLRAQSVLSAVEDVRAKTFRTKEEYDQYVGFVEGMLAPLGVRPHTIRSAVPFRAPTFGKQMTDALDAYFGSDMNKAAIDAGDPALFQGSIQIDTDGDGIADKPVPILQAIQEVGYNKVRVVDGKPIITPKASGTSRTISPDVEMVLKGLAHQFAIEKGRPPTPQEESKLYLEAERQLATVKRAPPSSEPSLIQITEIDPATGELVTSLVPKVPGQVSRRPGPAPTAGQSTAALYASRIEQAEPIIASLEPSITGMNLVSFQTQLNLPAALQSDKMQSFQQAGRNFINAVLRRESGAVISPSEFAEARQQYLPQPGDSPDVLEQKRQNRATVLRGLANEGGRAYTPTAGKISVTAPNGRTYTFATQEQADAFKRAAGMK